MKPAFWSFFFVSLCYPTIEVDPPKDPNYWRTVGRNQVDDILRARTYEKRAKNVIFFLGDGMGISTVTAGRIFMGQLQGKLGEEHQLTFEKFSNIGLSKTYCADKMISDSATTATSLFSGVKTILGVIGVDAGTERNNCASQQGREVDSILQWSLAAGKRVGIVTSTRVTHATPAALYAHVADREWEAPQRDQYMNTLLNGPCKDIARQLVEDNPDIHVVLGGGRKMFMPVTMPDPGTPSKNGSRMDNKDLIAEWQLQQQRRGRKYKYVWDLEELRKMDTANTDYVLGLMGHDHLEFEVDRRNKTNLASLAELTRTAIKLLQKDSEKGFFLMVEGGRIDHGHHDTVAQTALYDVVAFDEAIQAAISMINYEETLVVVTADHSHVFTMGGYPNRGAPILGLSENEGSATLAMDNMTFTILSYANGINARRKNVTKEEALSRTYVQLAAIPFEWESHGGEDVGIFSQGAMSHLFRGVVEQNTIAHLVAYASCVGFYKNNCTGSPATNRPATGVPQCQPNQACTPPNNGEAHLAMSPLPHLLQLVFTWMLLR